jgi:DNA-binding response OmpR family regulator
VEEEGADAFVAKPFAPELLIERVAELVQGPRTGT